MIASEHKYDIEPFPHIWDGTFHVYAFLRSEKRMMYGGLFLNKSAAMQDVRDSVRKLGLRCLFYWDVQGNYRCSGNDKHIYGRITLGRIDQIDTASPLPFDELDA